MNETPTSLYRHFASDGSLLYVGISLSWPARTKQHASGSPWFDQVAKVEIERFPDRAAAAEAEREAIKREQPRHNVVHNRASDGGTKPKWRVAENLDRLRAKLAADMATSLGNQRCYRGERPIGGIGGSCCLVGPALVYHGDKISVMVAWGEPGTPGELTELVLGTFFPEIPAWTDACASVISIRRPGEITIEEAREMRACIIRELNWPHKRVQAFDTDIALAAAYATQFPSEKSLQVLNEVSVEVGARR